MDIYHLADTISSGIKSSALLSRKSAFIFTAFLFLTLFFAGLFFSICISDTDAVNLTDPLYHTLLKTDRPYFISFIANLFLLLLILGAGFSLYGFGFALLIMSVKAISLGFCCGLIASSTNAAGLNLALFSLIPSSIPLITAFITVVSISANYAIITLNNHFSRQQYLKEYLLIFSVAATLLILSTVLEFLTLNLFRT